MNDLIEVWCYPGTNDINMYSRFHEWNLLTGIRYTPENAPFGVGLIDDEFLIHQDGIEHFLTINPDLRDKIRVTTKVR